jgi:hypothetical protein
VIWISQESDQPLTSANPHLTSGANARAIRGLGLAITRWFHQLASAIDMDEPMLCGCTDSRTSPACGENDG